MKVLLIVAMPPKEVKRNDQDFIVFLLGASEPLNPLKLPTTGDVLRAYSFLRNQMKTSAYEPTGMKSKIVDEILAIWNKASIPTVNKARVLLVFKACHAKIDHLRKLNSKEKKTLRYETKLNEILDKSTMLFDIAACKCDEANCRCISEKKVPNQVESLYGRNYFICSFIEFLSSPRSRSSDFVLIDNLCKVFT